MYHSLIRFSIAALAAVVLCGCGGSQPARITIEKSQYETDASSVYAERPVFSFMKNKELESQLNEEFDKTISGAMVEFDTAAEEVGTLSGGNKCVLEVKQEVKYNESYFVSILSEIYNYTGGAHGQTLWQTKNIDVLNNVELELKDLFSDNKYEEVLNQFIMEEIESKPEEYSDLWEKPVIKDSNQRDFYLTKDGLVVFYQPYDLSYYARGFVEFTIDWDKLTGYLKDDYKVFSGYTKNDAKTTPESDVEEEPKSSPEVKASSEVKSTVEAK